MRLRTDTITLQHTFYQFQFDHFDILVSDANKFRLVIKESLLMKRDQPQLNKTIKPFPLKLFD